MSYENYEEGSHIMARTSISISVATTLPTSAARQMARIRWISWVFARQLGRACLLTLQLADPAIQQPKARFHDINVHKSWKFVTSVKRMDDLTLLHILLCHFVAPAAWCINSLDFSRGEEKPSNWTLYLNIFTNAVMNYILRCKCFGQSTTQGPRISNIPIYTWCWRDLHFKILGLFLGVSAAPQVRRSIVYPF